MTEKTLIKHGADSTASQTHSPCNSFSSNQANPRIPSTGLTNSSCSDRPPSESGGGVVTQTQISGNVADFQSFLDDPGNLEWAMRTFPLEPGRSDRNIFVSKLPPTFKDADLHAMFQNFGPLVSTKVMLNVRTGVSKETGFVQFERHTDALRARAFLRLRPTSTPSTPPMPEVVTQWAQNKHDGGLYGERCLQVRKLFIRNLPASITQAEMKSFVSQYGEVVDISVHCDTYDPSSSSSFSVGRGRRSKQPTSEVAERQEVESLSAPSGGHETVICFVTFSDPETAMRACREVHNTTPFESCSGVPLMAKLAEDNSSRHARRHNNAASMHADPALWATCTPLCEGGSGYSSNGATPLGNEGGRFRDSDRSSMLALQRCGKALNLAGRRVQPPLLSTNCLSKDASPIPNVFSSSPCSVGSTAHSGYSIPAPRRAFVQPTTAISPTVPLPPASNTTPGSPSLLSSTMSPRAPEGTSNVTARQHQEKRARRMAQPQSLSLEAKEKDAPRRVIPNTIMSAPTSPSRSAGHGSQRTSRNAMNTTYHQEAVCCSPPPALETGAHTMVFSTPVDAPYSQGNLCGQQSFPMHHDGAAGSYHPSSDSYLEHNSRGPMNLWERGIGLILSAESSEAFGEYANLSASGECSVYPIGDNEYNVSQLWKRRMEHQRWTPIEGDMGDPQRTHHYMPSFGYTPRQSGMCTERLSSVYAGNQSAEWTGDLPQREGSAVMWRCAQYPQAMVINRGSQLMTFGKGSSGPMRYRNNPYSMHLLHTLAQN